MAPLEGELMECGNLFFKEMLVFRRMHTGQLINVSKQVSLAPIWLESNLAVKGVQAQNSVIHSI